jgi:hypothetical protein
MGISSVNLLDLQVTSTVVGENWQKSVNTLVSSLKKNRVCLVNLPAESASRCGREAAMLDHRWLPDLRTVRVQHHRSQQRLRQILRR